MNFALLGSIDGEVDALRKALDAIEDEGIITILQTGNIAWGSRSSEAIALLRERRVQCVQGKRDRILARLERKRKRLIKELGEEFPAYEAAHDALRAADIEWLGALPHERRLELDGVEVLLCHGIPGDQDDYFDKHTPAQKLERARETTAAQIIASGGSEQTFVLGMENCLIASAACLGLGPDAQWLRIDTSALQAKEARN